MEIHVLQSESTQQNIPGQKDWGLPFNWGKLNTQKLWIYSGRTPHVPILTLRIWCTGPTWPIANTPSSHNKNSDNKKLSVVCVTENHQMCFLLAVPESTNIKLCAWLCQTNVIETIRQIISFWDLNDELNEDGQQLVAWSPEVRARGFGERFDLKKHPQGTEIKAHRSTTRWVHAVRSHAVDTSAKRVTA